VKKKRARAGPYTPRMSPCLSPFFVTSKQAMLRCMDPEPFRIGILFNAFVTAVVSATAFALLFFLLRRWKSLTPGMRSYAWFWGATGLVWLSVTVRYLMVVGGYLNPTVHHVNEFILESSVFGSGIALYSYLGFQLFKNKIAAAVLATIVTIAAAVALRQLLLPGAFHPAVITFFTVDPKPSAAFLTIFGIMAGIALLLLCYYALKTFFVWKHNGKVGIPYETFYATSLIGYVILGVFDQEKIIIDWPLIVFRIFYTAVFLSAYLILSEDEAQRKDTYLIHPED